MLEKKSFKENFKIEIEKLKKMTFQDKIWYIKEYYGIQILLTIIVIAILGSIFYNMIFKKDPVFTAMYLNRPITNESYEKISTEFSTYAKLEETNDYWELKPNVNVTLKDGIVTGGMEYLAKTNAMIAGQLLDVLVTEEYFINHFANQNILVNFEEILPPDLLEIVKDDLVYIKNIDGIEGAFAIDVTNAPIIKESVYVAGPIYFSILANTKHLDTSILYLKYLYNI